MWCRQINNLLPNDRSRPVIATLLLAVSCYFSIAQSIASSGARASMKSASMRHTVTAGSLQPYIGGGTPCQKAFKLHLNEIQAISDKLPCNPDSVGKMPPALVRSLRQKWRHEDDLLLDTFERLTSAPVYLQNSNSSYRFDTHPQWPPKIVELGTEPERETADEFISDVFEPLFFAGENSLNPQDVARVDRLCRLVSKSKHPDERSYLLCKAFCASLRYLSHLRTGRVTDFTTTFESCASILDACGNHGDALFALRCGGLFAADNGQFKTALRLRERFLKESGVRPGLCSQSYAVGLVDLARSRAQLNDKAGFETAWIRAMSVAEKIRGKGKNQDGFSDCNMSGTFSDLANDCALDHNWLDQADKILRADIALAASCGCKACEQVSTCQLLSQYKYLNQFTKAEDFCMFQAETYRAKFGDSDIDHYETALCDLADMYAQHAGSIGAPSLSAALEEKAALAFKQAVACVSTRYPPGSREYYLLLHHHLKYLNPIKAIDVAKNLQLEREPEIKDSPTEYVPLTATPIPPMPASAPVSSELTATPIPPRPAPASEPVSSGLAATPIPSAPASEPVSPALTATPIPPANSSFYDVYQGIPPLPPSGNDPANMTVKPISP